MPNNFETRSRLALSIVLFTFASLLTGCSGSGIPDIVPVTVTVKTASGEPVNHALVRFVPMIEGLDGNFIASGVTDATGTCELSFPGKENEPGCCACEHKVQVSEGPAPDDARSAYGSDGGASIERFKRSLMNRPIPKKYGRLTTTPLLFTPSAENSTFDIVL